MGKEASYFYEAQVEWTGKRTGELRAPNLPGVRVAPPPEFQGEGGTWTPEHLYVASVNACFMITFLAIAGLSKLEVLSFRAAARGKLEKVDGLYQVTEIVIRPQVAVRSNRDLERASRILEKAEKNCFISNSIKTAIRVEPELFAEQTPTYPCPPVSKQ